jgi:hypothetical protein
VADAQREWEEAAQELVDDHVSAEALEEIRRRAESCFSQFREEIDAINSELDGMCETIPELPEPEIPDAEITDEQMALQAPIISTDMPWAKATLTLVARKAYSGDE